VNTLVTDQVVEEVTSETSSGTQTSNVVMNSTITSGQSVKLYMIAENNGADGSTTVQVLEGETVLASKYISVAGGSFVVVTIEVPLEGAGEHTLTVGGNTIVIKPSEFTPNNAVAFAQHGFYLGTLGGDCYL